MTHRRAYIVAGLGFGDEGKGTTVDFLTRQTGSRLIVRYNGGAQAAHNVVTPGGVHHTFSQFGSGMLATDPNIQTFLSQYMVIDPSAILKEADYLKAIGVVDPLSRLIIDERALVITPYHQVMNRIRELARGDHKHGSCGIGVGEAVSDKESGLAIYAGNLHDFNWVFEKLEAIRQQKLGLLRYSGKMTRETHEYIRLISNHSYLYAVANQLMTISKRLRIYPRYRINEIFKDVETPIFEGAQGALLDEKWGFYPHTTWSNCTTENAMSILKNEAEWAGEITTYGVTRAYGTRHGHGPFPTEDTLLTIKHKDTGERNINHPWQGPFRVGWFDGVLARYAMRMNNTYPALPIDRLVITNLDRLERLDKIQVCNKYSTFSDIPSHYSGTNTLKEMNDLGDILNKAKPEYQEVSFNKLVPWIEEVLSTKARIVSTGQTAKYKMEFM